MKSKKLLVLSLALLMLVGVSSCGGHTPVNPTDSTPISEAVDESDKPNAKKELDEKVDYVSNLKFKADSGRKYVEIDKVKSLIDGDTSHFYVKDADKEQFPSPLKTRDDGILKIRYLGIDTPESTGQVEEWGKTASLFNKSILSKAEKIIVESNDDTWSADSTGTRVMAYVWYKNAGETEYRNLNLEIMQEGYSFAKALTSLCYSTEFQGAFNQANQYELGVFSKAASMYNFATDGALQESNGFVLGSTKENTKILAFNKTTEGVNSVCVYDGDGKKITSGTKIKENIEKDPAYHLGMEVAGQVHYLTSIADGIGETTTDISKALDIHVEENKTTTKADYYSFYKLEEDNTHTYVTVNSVNNIDYMQRDKNFYYGSYLETTIRGLRSSPTTYTRKLVRFEGIIAKVAAQTVFMQEYDEELNQYFGVQVYLGFNCPATEYMVVGNRLSVCATFTYYETGGIYQVSGLELMKTKPSYEKNTKRISTGNEVVYTEITAADLLSTTSNQVYGGDFLEEGVSPISKAESLMNTAITMKNLTVTKVYTTTSSTDSNGALTLTVKDSSNKTITVRTEVLYDENKNVVLASQFEGKTINIKGIVDKYGDTYQAKVFSFKDVEFVA